MANDRLRSAMLEKGVSTSELATVLQVDPKSVERWVGGRTPYRRHRYAVAAHLGVDEDYIWPDALSRDQIANASESEIVNIYPHRWMMPSDMWRNYFDNAEREIGILVYVGLSLAEDEGFQRILRKKAGDGVNVRILLGDPDSENVKQRGIEEGIESTIIAKVHNALVLYRPLRSVDGVEFRLHGTTLYNSIYRVDDQLLVNTHIYGFPASHAPVLHLRRVAGGDMVSTYLESFERVWDLGRPLD